MHNMKKTILTICLGFLALGLFAQDMVYKPKNPAFGGETFNYNWLLSSAQAQNLIEDPDLLLNDQSSTLDDFAETLNRQLLNQLSRQLVTSQFGEQGLEAPSIGIESVQPSCTQFKFHGHK